MINTKQGKFIKSYRKFRKASYSTVTRPIRSRHSLRVAWFLSFALRATKIITYSQLCAKYVAIEVSK